VQKLSFCFNVNALRKQRHPDPLYNNLPLWLVALSHRLSMAFQSLVLSIAVSNEAVLHPF
jgi:hypothetical protein